MIKIEVAFATPTLQKIIPLEVAENTSIHQAIKQSEIAKYFPHYDLMNLAVGVFAKRILNFEQYQLKSGDRIEIYRPLNKNPQQQRHERVK